MKGPRGYLLVGRLETVQDYGKRLWVFVREHPLGVLGCILTLILLGWLGWHYFAWMKISHALEPKDQISSQTEAVKTVAQVLGGLLLLYGIYLTARRIRALERQVELSQEEQVTERFTRAIEQLGSDKMEVRLGGIYALERISKDSDKDYWTIMEVLTAFIRENASALLTPESEPIENKRSLVEGGSAEKKESIPKPRADVQAAITVLGRRARRFGKEEKHPLNLQWVDLRGANMAEGCFDGADLSGAQLRHANLWGVHLEHANLWGANLGRALLRDAHLIKAFLVIANLEKAILMRAHLNGAELSDAYLKRADFRRANLEGASLESAQLEGAIFLRAHLAGADFWGADLKGANFRGATDLSPE